MNHQNTTEKIIEQINTNKITPVSLWRLNLKNIILWVILFLTVFCLSWIISLVIYHIANNNWDLNRDLLYVVPFLFFLMAGILFFLSIFEFKNTERGYKFSNIAIIVVAIFIAGAIGAIFYFVGIAESTDKIFSDNIPEYNDYLHYKANRYLAPELGFITGKPINIGTGASSFDFIDINSGPWKVFITPATAFPLQKIMPEDFITIFGEVIEPGIFNAIEIKIANIKYFLHL